jgi:hypothetical protein
MNFKTSLEGDVSKGEEMNEENLKKIADGPVYLLEGNDGMVYGNSQALSREVLRLRETLRTIEKMVVRPVSMTDAESLLGSIERLAANTLHSWGSLGAGHNGIS